MLQWAKLRNLEERTQVIPCRAGTLTAVVAANGDVSVCELHEPLGNLRERSFPEIWASAKAKSCRASIAAKECHCTTEVFLWPSIVFQPQQLVRSMIGARVWEKPQPLPASERMVLTDADRVGTTGTPTADADAAAHDAEALGST
jgi:hypothetical protein